MCLCELHRAVPTSMGLQSLHVRYDRMNLDFLKIVRFRDVTRWNDTT